MYRKYLKLLGAATIGLAATISTSANADWKPVRPVEFIVPASPGGGTDQFARIVQSIIQKYQLMPVSIVVANKGGGGGSEAFVYAKTAAGDPHKVVFSTNLAYLMPMITRVGYKSSDIRPVAIMAADEFLLWTYTDAPYRTTRDLIDAARTKGAAFKMGGSQSKDTDHILTRQIERTTGVSVTYVPFKSGGEVAVQLAGGHVDANTNNPNENISHWKAGKVRPLCVFSRQKLTSTEKVTVDMAFSDVPTCHDEGIQIDQFNMPRTVWLTSGTTNEQIQYYIDVLAKVRETPEWKTWIHNGLQTDLFVTGKDFEAYIRDDEAKHRNQFREDGWLIGE